MLRVNFDSHSQHIILIAPSMKIHGCISYALGEGLGMNFDQGQKTQNNKNTRLHSPVQNPHAPC